MGILVAAIWAAWETAAGAAMAEQEGAWEKGAEGCSAWDKEACWAQSLHDGPTHAAIADRAVHRARPSFPTWLER